MRVIWACSFVLFAFLNLAPATSLSEDSTQITATIKEEAILREAPRMTSRAIDVVHAPEKLQITGYQSGYYRCAFRGQTVYVIDSSISRNDQLDALYEQEWSRLLSKYGNDVASTIDNGRIRSGMTEDMVIASWGRPLKIHRSGLQGFFADVMFVYEYEYVYFKNGALQSIEKRKHPITAPSN